VIAAADENPSVSREKGKGAVLPSAFSLLPFPFSLACYGRFARIVL
jgi:hypothetical protein